MAGWGGKANGRWPRPPAAMPWTYCLSSPLVSRGLSHPFRAPSPEQSCRQAFIRAGATPWHTMLNALVTERNGTGWTQSIKRHFKPNGGTCQPASKSCLHFGQVVRRVSGLCQFFFFLLWLCAVKKNASGVKPSAAWLPRVQYRTGCISIARPQVSVQPRLSTSFSWTSTRGRVLRTSGPVRFPAAS